MSEKCPMFESCQCKTATCVCMLPDESCYWYRWFKCRIEELSSDKTSNRFEDMLFGILRNYFAIGDSYTYELTRVKSAFEIGTMSLDDFEEWSDDNVLDLARYIIKNLRFGGVDNARQKTV